MYRYSVGKYPLIVESKPIIIPSKEKVLIYKLELPIDIVAFIYKLVLDNLLVELEWVIDDEKVTTEIDQPVLYFDPPFLVEKYTTIYAYNPTDKDMIMKIQITGVTHRVLSIIEDITPTIVEPVEEKTPIKELEESTVTGEILDRKITVTDTIYMLYDDKNKGLNWTACYITNNGPSNVYFCINKWKRPEAPLIPGLTANIDLGERGAIKKIFFVCDKGETTTVYIRILK